MQKLLSVFHSHSPTRSFSCSDSTKRANCCNFTTTEHRRHSPFTHTKYEGYIFITALKSMQTNIKTEDESNISLSSHLWYRPLSFIWISVGVIPTVSSSQTQPVVVTQPQPVPISLTYLQDIPGVVCCPYCHNVVTTKVRYLPGKAAWCMCFFLAVMGWACVFDATVLKQFLQKLHFCMFHLFFDCVFQVGLRFLSDSIYGERLTRCTSFLPRVWKPFVHTHKMILPELIRILLSSVLPKTQNT